MTPELTPETFKTRNVIMLERFTDAWAADRAALAEARGRLREMEALFREWREVKTQDDAVAWETRMDALVGEEIE